MNQLHRQRAAVPVHLVDTRVCALTCDARARSSACEACNRPCSLERDAKGRKEIKEQESES